MKFVLQYHGYLPSTTSSNNRTKDKQRVRKAFHPQLKELWRTTPSLAYIAAKAHQEVAISGGGIPMQQPVRRPGFDVRRRVTHAAGLLAGFKFVPLITKFAHLTCALDIKFLRSGGPGEVISGGDIDNRLKTLFDALRMPHTEDECGPAANEWSEEFFHCLLEDDSLITGVKVDAQRLLVPMCDDCRGHVALYITVTTGATMVTVDNLPLVM